MIEEGEKNKNYSFNMRDGMRRKRNSFVCVLMPFFLLLLTNFFATRLRSITFIDI